MARFKSTRSKDFFRGTSDEDTFVFTKGSSGNTTKTADEIKAWSTADSIDMPVAGRFSNYEEGSITFSRVEDVVDCINDKGRAMYVFAYNSKADTGYLLADLNNDNKYEMCIVLKDRGSPYDFSYSDII